MSLHRSHGLWLPGVPILRYDRLTSASDGRFLRSHLSSGPQSGTLFISYLFSCFCFLFPSLCLPLISVVNQRHCFTFMLPYIIIDYFLNNQPDALIIQIYSAIKLHVSGIFSAHHQEFFYFTFGTGKFHAGFWRPLPSSQGLCLEAVFRNLHETYQCRMYSRKTPDDGQRRCPKHVVDSTWKR